MGKSKKNKPNELTPEFSVESSDGGFKIARGFGPGRVATFAGKSLMFDEAEPVDPFETIEEATAAMEKYIQECTQGDGSDQNGEGSDNEGEEPVEKDFVVAVSIHKEIKVKAADKKDAIEKLKELPFGDHIGWENATPREV